jgi:tetratricopeptide (TPR) repeat protein
MSERRVQDYIKKVDFSDMKVLLVGVVLLIIPLIVLYLVTGSGRSRKLSVNRMKTMVNRKKIFNFAQSGQKSSSLPAQASQKNSKSWLAQDPEKKVVRELEEAFKQVQRSTRRERFPPGISRHKKQAYRAENHPLITEAAGKLEYGHLAEAEELFEQAFDQAGDNVFQKVYALGGLCEVYSRQNNQQKYEQAFKLFAEWVAKLPPEAGGGDLSGAVRDAYMALKELKNSADPNKVGVELDKVGIIKDGQLSKGNVSRGLSKSLVVFPAKYD